MQDFYFLVKFCLVLIYIFQFYRKKSSSILLRKNLFNSLLAFFFWKACTVSSFERSLCWKSRNYSQIYLPRFINYWDSILILYTTSGAFSLVCFLSVFFSFFHSSYFLFLSVFSLIETNDSWDRRDGRQNHYFSRFPLPPANEHSFNSTRFIPLIFTLSICNYQTDSWWDLFPLDISISFAFLWMHLSRSNWLWHFKLTVRSWACIKLSLFYYKANALAQWDLHP